MGERCRYLKIMIIWILTGSVNLISAQVQFPGRPYGPSRELKAAEVMYVLPPVDPLEVEASLETNRTGSGKAIEFALERPVDLSPDLHGSWLYREGTHIWQVHIISPGAFSLGLVFNEYALAPGVKIFVYDPGLNRIKGAYTSGNNKKSGILPVGHIDGDELVVEMQVPPELDGFGQLRIESVSHAFLNLKHLAGIKECDPGTFGCSQPCMIDVNCDEGSQWQTEKRSVVRFNTTSKYCTGVLVNNTSYNGAPYILTAQHCIDRPYYAERAVFDFNYESPTCFGEDGPKNMSIAGCDTIAVGDSIDFSLVKLSVTPPESYGAYYAGWDLSDSQNPGTVSIHHPWGDVKKITKDFQSPSIPDRPGDVPYSDLDDYHYFSYWWIKRWDVGSTEGGSSGSPLFNSDGRVIGLLSGGIARCGDSIGYDAESGRVLYSNVFNYDDYYTQMRFAWDYYGTTGPSLKPWLDPVNSGVSSIGGYDPTGNGPPRPAGTSRFSIYPNPARGTLYIRSQSPFNQVAIFEIYNLSGQVETSGSIESADLLPVDLSGLIPGIYLMQISNGLFRETHKFVIIP